MRQIVRTLLVSVFALVLVVATISSIWLALEKKKLAEQYAKDRELWSIRNRTLKESLNRSEESIRNLKEELEKITQELKNSSGELSDLKLSYENLKTENISLSQKVKYYSQEKENLLMKISQLEKDLKASEEARQVREAQEEFWARILKEKADLEFRARELEEKIRNNRAILAQLEGERNNLETRLNEVQLEKMKLEKTLMGEKGLNSPSPKDVLKVSLEKENMEKRLVELAREKDELEIKINTLKLEIETVESEKKELANKINGVNQLLEERLSEVNRVRQELELALSRAKQVALSGTAGSVELPPIVVKKEEAGEKESGIESGLKKDTEELYPPTLKFIPPKTKEAEVVLVNETHSFIILNIGKLDGVVEGMGFDVYENKEIIAKVKIREVRDRLSAAQILEVGANKKIKTGAEVKYSQ